MKADEKPTVIYVRGEFNEALYRHGLRLLNELIDETLLLKEK